MQQNVMQQQAAAAQQAAMQQQQMQQRMQQQQQQQQQQQNQVRPPPPMHNPWVQCYDQQGQMYYFNESTNETAWQLPPGVCARNATGGQQAPPQQFGGYGGGM